MINFQGIILGVIAFSCIGVFHPLVIKGEYYFGTRIWPVFLCAGIATLGASLFMEEVMVSASFGVFGFSSLWSVMELFKQAERVEKGWFPKNPIREYPD